MATFEIRLFGAIEVYRDGQAVSGFRSQKTLALLAYLIVEDRPLTRDYLAGLLWPDTSQPEALGHLRRALYNLTQCLPGCLEIDRRVVRFHPAAPAVVDVRLLAELMSQAYPDSLRQAAVLVRTTFLEGIYLRDCPEFETWIITQQERWRHVGVRLLESLIREWNRQGAYDQALPYAQQLVRLDPWREECHRQLMRLLVYTGQREAALRQYKACRNALLEELALPVSAVTTELFERLRDAPLPPYNLPPETVSLVGRQAELEELQVILADPACRLTTLMGPGGIGKTQLALALAQQVANHFVEGVWFVALSDVSSAAALLAAVAATLNVTFSEGSEPRGQLLDTLRTRELLLVLDNFEQLVEAGGADLVGAILAETTAVKLLVTSRRQVGLRQERLFDLGGLSYPPAGIEAESVLPGATPGAYDAVALFERVVRQRQRHFSLAGNETAVVDICRLVAGTPLAIEMAAAAVPARSCADIAAAIRENLDTLQVPYPDALVRQRSVRAVFNHSWSLLEREERKLLARLSVFQGKFTTAAAREISGATVAQLAELCGRSWLRQTGDARYQVHELLRQYAAEKLAQELNQAEPVRRAHAGYYLDLIATEGARLAGEAGEQAQETITANLANVRAAWLWATQACAVPFLLNSLEGLRTYYEQCGLLPEVEQLLAGALAAVETLAAESGLQEEESRILHGRLLAAMATILGRQGKHTPALPLAQRAVAVAEAVGDIQARVVGNCCLARASVAQGNYRAGKQKGEKALRLAREAQWPIGEVVALRELGVISYRQGQYHEALAYYEAGLLVARATGDRRSEARLLYNAGLTKAHLGQLAPAETDVQQALLIARRLNFLLLEAMILEILGMIATRQGNPRQEITYLRQAARVHRRTGNRYRMGLNQYNLAAVYCEVRDYASARPHLEEAIELFQKIELAAEEGAALRHKGMLLLDTGQYNAARATLERAVSLLEQADEKPALPFAFILLGQLALQVGDWPLAQAYAGRSAAVVGETGETVHASEIHSLLALLNHYQDREEAAIEEARLAVSEATVQQNDPRIMSAALVCLGKALGRSRPEEALAAFRQAVTVTLAAGQPYAAADARAGMARIALTQGDLTEALAQVTAVLEILDAPEPPNTLDGSLEPLSIYWTCYQVLCAAGDETRAQAVLREAYQLLQTRAGRLEGDWRCSFLEKVPASRAIATAWRGTAFELNAGVKKGGVP
jgi:predicted ATPase/DNA-binding SARP family transcriptional activator